MSLTIVLPGQLRDLSGGNARVELRSSKTVADALQALRLELPAVYDRIVTEQGSLRPHVNVFVDNEDIRWSGGMDTPLTDGSRMTVLPSVSGG